MHLCTRAEVLFLSLTAYICSVWLSFLKMIFITWFETLKSKLFRGFSMSFDQSTLSNTHITQDSVDVYSLALILCRAHSHSIRSFELFISISCSVPKFWWSGTSLDNWVSRFSELISTSTSGVFSSPLLPDLDSSYLPLSATTNCCKLPTLSFKSLLRLDF